MPHGTYFALLSAIPCKGPLCGTAHRKDHATQPRAQMATKEQLGGYYVIEVANLDGALDWAAKCPAAAYAAVEVRPILVR
jgi:hypothetical protein